MYVRIGLLLFAGVVFSDPAAGQTALTLDSNTSDSLRAGIPNTYSFDAPAGTLVNVAMLAEGFEAAAGDNRNVTVTVTSPSNEDVGSFTVGQGFREIGVTELLEGGTYEIDVAGISATTTGSYTLGLAKIDLPTNLGTIAAPFEDASDELQIIGEHHYYRFNALAEDAYDVTLHFPGAFTGYLIIGRAGPQPFYERSWLTIEQISGTNRTVETEVFQVDEDGQYIIEVAPRPSSSPAGITGAYSLRAFFPNVGTAEIGEVTAGSISTPYGFKRYAFNAEVGQLLLVRTVGENFLDNQSLQVSLHASDGTRLETAYPNVSAPARETRPYLIPASGTYRLQFDPVLESTADFEFRIVDLPPPEPIASAVPWNEIAGTLTPGERHYYRVTGAAGQIVSADVFPGPTLEGSIRLRRDDENYGIGSLLSDGVYGSTDVVFAPGTTAAFTVELPEDGAYILEVDGADDPTVAEGDYTLRYNVVDPAPDAVVALDPAAYPQAVTGFVRAAVRSVPAYGSVQLRPGTYTEARTVIIDRKGVSLLGPGRDQATLRVPTHAAVHVRQDSVRIEALTLDSDLSEVSGQQGIVFINNPFAAVTTNAITIADSRMRGSFTSGMHGIYTQSAVHRSRFEGNEFDITSTSSSSTAIFARGDSIVVAGNRINADASQAFGSAIRIQQANDVVVSNNVIGGGGATLTFWGIQVNGWGSVLDNRILAYGRYGINISGNGADTSTVERNLLTGGGGSSPIAGIRIWEVKRASVASNHVAGFPDHLALDIRSTGGRIENNRITAGGTSPAVRINIRLSESLTLANNTIQHAAENSTSRAVYVETNQLTAGSTVPLRAFNNIVVGPGGTSEGVRAGMPLAYADYNLVYNFGTPYNDDWTRGPHDVEADPRFDDADMRLDENSPAVDAGINSVTVDAESFDAPVVDFENRPRPQGAAFDMGAHEALASGNTALVTFNVDVRQLMRVGLFRPELNMKAFVEVYDGLSPGIFQMSDVDGDSIFSVSQSQPVGVDVQFAYLVDPKGNQSDLDFIRERAGSARSFRLDAAAPVDLPAVAFDDMPLREVPPGSAAVSTQFFRAGNSALRDFRGADGETYVSIDMQSLDRNALIAVRRFAADPGGSPPSGIAVVSSQAYWTIEHIPASATLSADLVMDVDPFSGIVDVAALRLLRRTAADWTVIPSVANTNEGLLTASGVTEFSEWTLASATTDNSLVASQPGLVALVGPDDGEVISTLTPTLEWAPVTEANTFDVYFWQPGDPKQPQNDRPSMPSDADVTSRTYRTGRLDYDTQYAWQIKAKNLYGETWGPVWSFDTAGRPDYTVTNVEAPEDIRSGQTIEARWTVANISGFGSPRPDWLDAVILSVDSTFDRREDIVLHYTANTRFLEAGDSYDNRLEVSIPEDVFGTYYLLVEADHATGFNVTTREIDETNNVGWRLVDIALTPPPDLRVASITAPSSAFSEDTLTVIYTIENAGTGPTVETAWHDYFYLSDDESFESTRDHRLPITNRHEGALQAGESYTDTVDVVLPTAVYGDMHLYVITDLPDGVFEHTADGNNASSVPLDVTLRPPPDLVPTNVVLPDTVVWGQEIALTWTVRNQGAGATTTRSWMEGIYLSAEDTLNVESATLLETVWHNGEVAPGMSYTGERTITIPNGISGPHSLFFFADNADRVFEFTEEHNNVLAVPFVVEPAQWPDLQIADVEIPSSVTAGSEVEVQWTLRNAGEGDAEEARSRLYLSTSETWMPRQARDLRVLVDVDAPAAAEDTVLTRRIRMPADVSGAQYLFVLADPRDQIYEHTDEENNVGRSSLVDVAPYPPIDLAVTINQHPSSGSSGQAARFSWTVENEGEVATLARHWIDAVYLSSDALFDPTEDALVLEERRAGALNPGDGYSRTIDAPLPNGISGSFYVIIVADVEEDVGDADRTNNAARSPAVIPIELTPPPDLQVATLNAPASLIAGQPFELVWSFRNEGTGPAVPPWRDALYLSKDALLKKSAGSGDHRIRLELRDTALLAGETRPDTLEVQIPYYITSGTYHLVADADTRDAVYEHGSETNNTRAVAVQITQQPPVDLVVRDVAVASEAEPGEVVTVSWTLENTSSNALQGRISDGVFFSDDQSWSSDDALLGVLQRRLELDAGSSMRMSKRLDLSDIAAESADDSLRSIMPGLTTGSHYALVRTNIKNNIRESDFTNNAAASASPVDVSLPELISGVVEDDTLAGSEAAYWFFEAAGGEDVRLTLNVDGDAPLELYVAQGRLPSRADFDLQPDVPLASEQTITIPTAATGTYFVQVLNPSRSAEVPHTISLEIPGFEISRVTPSFVAADHAGDGECVIDILGAQFDAGTAITFERSDRPTVSPLEQRLLNSTHIRTLVDMTPLVEGPWTVVATKGDNSRASVPGLTIGPPDEPNLVTSVEGPPAARPGSTLRFTVTVSNGSTHCMENAITWIDVNGVTEEEEVNIHFDPTQNEDFEKEDDAFFTEEEDPVTGNSMGPIYNVPLAFSTLPPGGSQSVGITLQNACAGGIPNASVGASTHGLSNQGLRNAQNDAQRGSIGGSGCPYGDAGICDAWNHRQRNMSIAKDLNKVTQSAVCVLYPCPGGSTAGDVATTGLSEVLDHRYQNTVGKNLGLLGKMAGFASFFMELIAFHDKYADGAGDSGMASTDCVSAVDPNDIIGPAGAGDGNWVVPDPFHYMIRFENDPEKATAAAQIVTIDQVLDSTLNVASFRLGAFGFGSFDFEIPSNRSFYSSTLDVQDSLDVVVKFDAGIDVTERRAFWRFEAVDPKTGLAPADPFAGFLPVNDSLHRGEGYVTYTIHPIDGIATGERVDAEARIVFDINDPIDTPPIFNTIDREAPSSQVVLPAKIGEETFQVAWTSNDSGGSGAYTYDLYVSQDGGPFELYREAVRDTATAYAGAFGHTYGFFTIATDQVGFTEPMKSEADAVVSVEFGVGIEEEELPREFALGQNYPNPFNPETTILFSLPRPALVTMEVFDVLGRRVSLLLQDEMMQPGRYDRRLNGGSWASGVYFYRISARDAADGDVLFRSVKKMLLVK